jgi:c(7)-type cytochrome triheme protein
VIAHSDDSPGKVVFDHATHTDVSEPACASCHSGTYSILGRLGSPRVREPIDFHDKSHCGRCHDGEEAFDLDDDDECGTCHME